MRFRPRHIASYLRFGFMAALPFTCLLPAARADCQTLVIAVPEALAGSPLKTIMIEAYERAGIAAEFRNLPNRRTAVTTVSGDIDAQLITADINRELLHLFAPVPVPIAYITYYAATYRLTPKDLSSIEAINRHRVALPSGFSHIARLLGNPDLVELGTYDAILNMLEHERVDVAIGTQSFGRYAELKGDGLKVFPAPITPRFGYHMLRPACRTAYHRLKESLAAMVAAGRFVDIYAAGEAPDATITPGMLESLGPAGGLAPEIADELDQIFGADTLSEPRHLTNGPDLPSN